MNDKLNITINNPCSEKFDQFITTKKGGFCNSCNKEVIDFSMKSDNEIVNYFSSENQKTCGYFRQDQLKTYSNTNLSNHKTNFWNRSLLGFSIVSLLSFNQVFSQEKNSNINIHNTQNIKHSDSIKLSKKIIVKGTVSDESGTLPGASVVLKNSTIGVVTDFDGNFEFAEPLEVGSTLIVGFAGFKRQEFIVSDKENKFVLNVMLDDYECIIMGDVSTNKVYKTKKSFLQKLTSFFKND